MQVYGPSYLHGPQSIGAPHSSPAQRTSSSNTGSAPIRDEVEISSQGELLSKMSEIPDIRHEKVAALKAAIASGTYDTDARLGKALDRLLDEIG
jgi:negative regulator of flagellin synthesis FlgM